MDSNTIDFSAIVENLLMRVEALEKEVALLKGTPLTEETPEPMQAEPIDLSLDNIDYIPAGDVATIGEKAVETDTSADDAFSVEEGPSELPEDIPAPEPKPEEEPAPQIKESGEDSMENLFGEESSPSAARRGRRRRILNDLEGLNKGDAVMDVMTDKAAWRHDIPGPEVKSLRSAIGLGDQVLFIRRLFRDDSALYQDSIDKLNSMSTMDEAIEYLSSTFPEWNVASDDVYKFMMAVRRKIRK